MKIFRAILGNIVGFVSVFATYSLSFLLLTLVIYILNIIPIIKDIFNFLLQIRNDYLEGSMVFIAVVVSYYVSKIIINAINGNNKKATSISQVIIGILIELIFKWSKDEFLMIKDTIHKQDRHHKPLGT